MIKLDDLFQSTHPAGGATSSSSFSFFIVIFQSTHPAGGATACFTKLFKPSTNFNPRTPRGVRPGDLCRRAVLSNFNPRTPRGVRPVQQYQIEDLKKISIHAPRGGCDPALTSKVRGSCCISIHAPRGGCDSFQHLVKSAKRYFNPRTPRGVRQGNYLMHGKQRCTRGN